MLLLLVIVVLLEEEVVMEEEVSRDKRPRCLLQLLIATATTSQYLNTYVKSHTPHNRQARSPLAHTHMVAMIWSSVSNTPPCLFVNSMTPNVPDDFC